MGNGGLSAAGLTRLHRAMAGYVERGDLPGVVTVVSRRGETHVDAIGSTAFGAGPMRADTIFRISSMTKPVTAVATMILLEDCVLRLDDPVDPWLPELADRRVLTRLDGPLDETVPANRPITVRDLLDFRLGIGVLFQPMETYPIFRAENELGLRIFGPPKPAPIHPPDEWIRRLGTLPLMFQPGERWTYDAGSMVLGVLLERAAGEPLESFLRDRIFDPLDMHDTGFTVPADKLDRFATSYAGETGTLEAFDNAADSQWANPPAFPDGSGGLVSTAADYLRFAEMVLNDGERDGVRILSRPSVTLMRTNHLTREQRNAVDGFGEHTGWGFGVSVGLARNEISATPGRYGWVGGLGTSWYNDPAEGLIAISLTQRMVDFAGPYQDFWTSVYAAIDD